MYRTDSTVSNLERIRKELNAARRTKVEGRAAQLIREQYANESLNELLSLESDVIPIDAAESSRRLSEAKNRLLTDREVCMFTGLNRVTLYRLRTAGRIGYYKFGNVISHSAEHLREFLAAHERKARHSDLVVEDKNSGRKNSR